MLMTSVGNLLSLKYSLLGEHISLHIINGWNMDGWSTCHKFQLNPLTGSTILSKVGPHTWCHALCMVGVLPFHSQSWEWQGLGMTKKVSVIYSVASTQYDLWLMNAINFPTNSAQTMLLVATLEL